jgi:hypothetical protein
MDLLGDELVRCKFKSSYLLIGNDGVFVIRSRCRFSAYEVLLQDHIIVMNVLDDWTGVAGYMVKALHTG